jgi:hypothetical protein
MAGYSGTPLPQKLGIKEGARLGLVRAPTDFARTLGALPAGVVPRKLAVDRVGTRRASPDGSHRGRSGTLPGFQLKPPAYDVIVCFTRTMAEVARDVPALRQRLDPAGGLWMAWPKQASGVKSDVNENLVRARGLAAGLVDNKVCAIDDVWSGLRFVFRLADRPKPSR